MNAIEKVGFVGIGNMGAPMARHLVQAGFDVTVMDTRQAVVESFTAAHGCRAAGSPRELGDTVDAVITMLPTSTIVRAVILGADDKDGVADGLNEGKLVIDMSTSNPIDTRSLGDALSRKGIDLMDAPVAGGVVFAVDGSLTIMTGGAVGLKARARPLFEAMGGDLIDCGPLGGAHAMKALNNYVNAAGLIAGIEAMAVALKFGLAPETVLAALKSACTGRNNPIEKKLEAQILSGRLASGMAMGLIAKDVHIAVDSAMEVGAFVPLAEKTAALWQAASDRFGFDLDQTELVRLWEAESDVTIAGEQA